METIGTDLAAIETVRQPVVAGIERAAPAGAFELTLARDLRVLGADASYGVIEVKLGTFPHAGGTQRLPRLVGLSKAKEIVLTGEYVPPEEALACGLVHELCELVAIDERAKAFAADLCENAPSGWSARSDRSTPPSRRRKRRGWRSKSRSAAGSTTRATTGKGSTRDSRAGNRSSRGGDRKRSEDGRRPCAVSRASPLVLSDRHPTGRVVSLE